MTYLHPSFLTLDFSAADGETAHRRSPLRRA